MNALEKAGRRMDLQSRARRLVSEIGLAEASRKLGLTRESIARLIAGLDVKEGTAVTADMRLPKAER